MEKYCWLNSERVCDDSCKAYVDDGASKCGIIIALKENENVNSAFSDLMTLAEIRGYPWRTTG